MPGHRSPLTAVTVAAPVVQRPAEESTVFVSPRWNGSLAAGTSTTFGFITSGSATAPRSPAPDHP
jgi:hypothetical protein